MKKINVSFFAVAAAAASIGPEERRFNNIMNARKEIGLQHAGSLVKCQVSGNPQYDYWDERVPDITNGGAMGVLKDIYSLNLSKATVLDSAWFAGQHAEAVALEAAGDSTGARKLFDELMNKSQLSYSVIQRGNKERFSSGQPVEVLIDSTDVEEKDANGVVIGTHKAVICKTMIAQKAVAASSGRRFGADVVVPTPAPALPIGATVAPHQ